MTIKNALISVSNKNGIIPFAKSLGDLGISMFSTGNTFRKLSAENIKVSYIEALTGLSEMLNGRVRTLHPNIHGGILHRRDSEEHKKTLSDLKILPIDLVVVNLYPFKQVAENNDSSMEDAIENIDIGGVALLRAAAKNYRWVTVVCEQQDLDIILQEIKDTGNTSLKTRERLAVKAFKHTMTYDTQISHFLSEKLLNEELETLTFTKTKSLRYGENPHQASSLFQEKSSSQSPTTPLSLPHSTILHGKEMSHNNYLDAEAALRVSWDFTPPTVAIVKHQNPCGIATGATINEALTMAWEGDIISSFGSVISFNRSVDLATAEFLKGKFVEIILAPSFDEDALTYLRQKSKNLRIIQITPKSSTENHFKKNYSYQPITGGILRQEKDYKVFDQLEIVSESEDTDVTNLNRNHYSFSFTCVKHIKSNAIAITHEYQADKYMLIGMGAGQPNRVDALKKLALVKTRENLTRLYPPDQHSKIVQKLILSSDAFFPFKDNVEFASEFGIKRIIQPGGSTRDNEVIEQAKQDKIEMALTHTRHFLH